MFSNILFLCSMSVCSSHCHFSISKSASILNLLVYIFELVIAEVTLVNDSALQLQMISYYNYKFNDSYCNGGHVKFTGC